MYLNKGFFVEKCRDYDLEMRQLSPQAVLVVALVKIYYFNDLLVVFVLVETIGIFLGCLIGMFTCDFVMFADLVDDFFEE